MAVKVLVKKKSSCSFSAAGVDEFEVNEALSSKHRIVRVPVPVQDEAHNKGVWE